MAVIWGMWVWRKLVRSIFLVEDDRGTAQKQRGWMLCNGCAPKVMGLRGGVCDGRLLFV